MNKKFSEVKDNEILLVCTSNNYDGDLVTKQDILEDLDYYKNKIKTDDKFEVYTTNEVQAELDARHVLEDVIETEECDNMYEDWGEKIWDDITDEDIADIQTVLNKILSKNPKQNIAYHSDVLLEMDI